MIGFLTDSFSVIIPHVRPFGRKIKKEELIMTKRIISLALLAVMALALIPAAQAADRIMYVSPAKGTTVNLRSTPEIKSNNSNLICEIPYGTALTVKYISNGWACIDYGVGRYDEAYMMAKYLTNYYVAPSAANTKRTANKDVAAVEDSALADHYKKMNGQFRTFRLVSQPYTVYGKPERVSGWSNLRYAPNEKATLVRQVRLNEALTVIGETDRWYQVTDPVTGITGYISRFYVSLNMN